MHTLSACGASPRLPMLPCLGRFGKPGGAAEGAEAFAAVFGGVDFALGEAEVVPDLVPDSVGDDSFEMDEIAGHFLVGVLEDADAVGAVGEGGIGDRALGGGAAFVEPEEIGIGSGWLHDDDEIVHAGSEAGREAGDGTLYDGVELFGCEPEGHFARIESMRAPRNRKP